MSIVASPAGAAPGTRRTDNLQNVIRRVLPSVEEIQSGTGLDSGIVDDDNGYIMTNAQV